MSRRSPLCIKWPLCTSQIGKEEKPSKRQNISVCPLHSHARAPRERETERETERERCLWLGGARQCDGAAAAAATTTAPRRGAPGAPLPLLPCSPRRRGFCSEYWP